VTLRTWGMVGKKEVMELACKTQTWNGMWNEMWNGCKCYDYPT